MKWLKTIAVFGCLALWLAASNHCRLELLSVLDFCCEKDGSFPAQEGDCQTDGCAALEGSFYKLEDTQSSLPAPTFVSALALDLAVNESTPSCSIYPPLSHPDTVPAELSVRWQFNFRVAAPPRAPSPVS